MWNIAKSLYIFLLLVYANIAICGDVEIFVDGSDSMRGFFVTGSIQESVRQVINSAMEAKLPTEAKVFLSSRNENQVRIVSYDSFIQRFTSGVKREFFGTSTLLDLAYDKGIKSAKILYIITDNVHQQEEINTRAFYQKFNDQNIKYIYLIPEILDFRGPIYFDSRDFENYNKFKEKLSHSNFDGKVFEPGANESKSPYTIQYEGKRGLVIYSILLDADLKDQYMQILRNLRKSGREILLVKPIDNKCINIQGVTDRSTALKVIDSYLKQHSKEERNFANKLPNMTIEQLQKKNILRPLDDAYPPKFHLDSQNYIRFWFTLSSKLRHINIGKPENTSESNILLTISDLSFQFKNNSIEKAVNLTESPEGKIVPSVLLGNLSAVPSEIHDENVVSKNKYYYISEIDFGPFKINWNLGSFFYLLGHRTIPAVMTFNIRMTVPPHQIYITEDFKSKYFTYDMTQLDRIYTPVDLFSYLSDKPINIDIGVIMQ